MSETSPIVPGRVVSGDSNTDNLQVTVRMLWTLGCTIGRVAGTPEWLPLQLLYWWGQLDGEQRVQQGV